MALPPRPRLRTSNSHFCRHIAPFSNQVQASTIDQDQHLLEILSSTAACLKEKHMAIEALGWLEQSLWLKRRMFGVDSSAVLATLSDVMLTYNSLAMTFLSTNELADCIALLRKAEAIVAPGNFSPCQALQILTFNNFGCYYRKVGNLKLAFKYLNKAAQIGSGSVHVKNLSQTHLNLCAIHSQLNRHDLALEHAQAAIFHTQKDLVRLEDEPIKSLPMDLQAREEYIITLAVAYYNLAVQLEFTRQSHASLQWYERALQLVKQYRATNKRLFTSFRQVFRDMKQKQPFVSNRQNDLPFSSQSPASSCVNDVNQRYLSYSSMGTSKCYKSTSTLSPAPRFGSTQRTKKRVALQRPKGAKCATFGNQCTTSQIVVDHALELHWQKLEHKHNLNDDEPKMDKKRRLHRASATKRRHEIHQQQTGQWMGISAQKDTNFIGHDTDVIDAIRESGPLDRMALSYRAKNQKTERFQKGPRCALEPLYRESRNTSQAFEGAARKCRCINKDIGPAPRVCHLEYLRRMKKLADGIKDDLNERSTRVAMAKDATMSAINASVPNECGPKVYAMRRAPSKLRDEIEQARCESKNQVEAMIRPNDQRLKLLEHGGSSPMKWKRDVEQAVKQRQQAQLTKDSAIILQRQVRRYFKERNDKRRVQDEANVQLELQRREVKDLAVCCIQRLWRRARGRNGIQPKAYDYPLMPAIIVPHLSLSSFLRGQTDVKGPTEAETKQYDKEDYKVPTRVSTSTNVTPSNEAIQERNQAAIRIKAFLKGFIVRYCLAHENARNVSRMYIERQHFGITFNLAMAFEPEFLKNLSVAKIQALVRAHQSRRALKAGFLTVATTL